MLIFSSQGPDLISQLLLSPPQTPLVERLEIKFHYVNVILDEVTAQVTNFVPE